MRELKVKLVLNSILLIVLFTFFSCNDTRNSGDGDKVMKITQQADGSISLHIENAVCYHNRVDPSLNTAEWNIVIAKPGRYQVWLTSAAKDTMNLDYREPVRIDLNGERLIVKPVGNKIVKNADNINAPYYRADSYMGSFYIEKAGEYNLQVISDKIMANQSAAKQDPSENTLLMSIMLMPM